jgi:hypothetical protein
MSGFSKKSKRPLCPIPDERRQWLEYAFEWLVGTFGEDAICRCQVIKFATMKIHYLPRIALLIVVANSSILLFTNKADAQVANVKLELYNHQVWLKAGLTGMKTDMLNFLFDSGAGIALLDSTVDEIVSVNGKNI